MNAIARITTAFVLSAVAATTLAGCSGDSPAAPRTTAAATPLGGTAAVAPSDATSAVAVTRWWGNSAARAGSTVDVAHPSAAAAKLHPSRTEYCDMLRQTLAAGHSVLSGVRPSDPKYAATTTAFVTELEHVAPAEVARSWQVLGTTIIALVSGQGAAHADPATIRTAVTTVSADARTRCRISLSRTP